MDTRLRTDEYLESMNSLEMVCDQLPNVIDNPHTWKWVIISLHNALQGYMVLALKGSNSLDVRTRESKEKWLAAYWNKTGNFPSLYTDKFLDLYKKIRKIEFMTKYALGKPFKPKGTQTASVKLLNKLRNDFIHYFPQSMSLLANDFPEMTADCVDIIGFLTFESGNILPTRDGGLETRARDIIKDIRLRLDTICAEYKK